MNTFINYYCNNGVRYLYYKIKHYLTDHKNMQLPVIISIFFILTLAEVATIALLSHHIVRFGDFVFHNNRLIEVCNDIMHSKGKTFTQYVGYPRGIATNAFYPCQIYALFAPLCFFIKKPITMLFTVWGITSVIRYLISYFSYKSYDNNAFHSFIFAIIYSLNAVPFYWSYVSEDIGASLAIVFLPLAFFGCLDYMRDTHKWMMLFLGMVLITYSHLITALLTAILLALIYLMNFKKADMQKLLGTSLLFSCYVLTVIPCFSHMVYFMVHGNNILFPGDADTAFSDGLFMYTPDFFGILIPILAVIIMCLKWKKTRLDKQLFWIGMFCVLINVKLIGTLLTTALPFLKQIQFAIRFDIIGNITLCFILMDFFIHYQVKAKGTVKLHRSLIEASMMILLLIIPPCFEVTEPGALIHKPLFTHQKKVSLVENLAHNHHAGTEYSINNPRLEAMEHEAFYTDYMPKRATKLWRGQLRQKPYVFKGNRPVMDKQAQVKFKKNKLFVRTNHLITDVQVPFVLYNGISYRFVVDGKELSFWQVNHHLSQKYQTLTLTYLPKGNNEIYLKSYRG